MQDWQRGLWEKLNTWKAQAKKVVPLEEKQESCPRCGGRGLVLRGEEALPCLCIRQRSLERRFNLANITSNLKNCTFQSFDLRFYSATLRSEKSSLTFQEMAKRTSGAAHNFVAECLTNPHARGLFINGPVGSGKTFLAGAIANALVEAGKAVLFAIVPDFLDELRATHDEAAVYSEQELMEAARSVEVLLLDDLGAHNYTEWTGNRIYSLLNYRLNNWLPTVITTNLELVELEEYLGERTTSRIVQLCRPYRLEVEEDIRFRLSREEK